MSPIRRRVILESPYRGVNYEALEDNVAYARACMRHCLLLGEAPFASHLLYTQEGILDDKVPLERQLGIDAGLAWGKCADATVVYIDRGFSRGMLYGIQNARACHRPVEYRSLSGMSLPCGDPTAPTC